MKCDQNHCLTMIDKAIAFLWAVWLIFGPDEKQVCFFLNLVVSFTTDMGTELLHVYYAATLPMSTCVSVQVLGPSFARLANAVVRHH